MDFLPSLPIDGQLIPLVMAIALVAGALQGVVGFGYAVIAGPLLVLIDPRFVPGPMVMVGLVLVALVALRERQQPAWKDLGLLTAGRLIGSVAGGFVIFYVSIDVTALLFGILLSIVVAVSALGYSVEPTIRTIPATGVFSGLLSTVAGIGGAPAALLHQRDSGSELRGRLALYAIPGGSISLATIAVARRLQALELAYAVLLLPGVLLGFVLSRVVNRWVDQSSLRPYVLAVAGAAALGVLIRSILRLA